MFPTRCRWILLCLLLALLPVGGRLFAEPTKPAKADREAAVAVCMVLQEGHLLRRSVDDQMSRRLYRRFLDAFDPFKLYFLEADAMEFAGFETLLDDLVIGGDIDFAYLVYRRFLKRLETRIRWALEDARGPHDWAKEERVIVDADATVWAKGDEEARERWRVRVKHEILSLIVDGTAEEEARKRIERRYQAVAREWHQFSDMDLVEMFLNALTGGFDPHTNYLSPSALEDFEIGLELSLEGIGAVLTSEDGVCEIREIIPGGAADLDGRLKPGDRIVGVGQGETGEILDVVEMRLRDVVKVVRGKAGTLVRLEVIPAKSQKREIYAMLRRKIELKDRGAKGEVVDTPGPAGGRLVRVGIIDLPSFYAADEEPSPGAPPVRTATDDVRKILRDFKTQGVETVVLDLRYNGGGLLNEAIGITGLFVDQGPVVLVKDARGRVLPHLDEEPGVEWSGPLIVAVSRFTASASEIVAGAVQDYGRGLIVGDSHTHGKGTVQRILPLEELVESAGGAGALKLTMQKFYRPGGTSTQVQGVVSDIVLPSWTDHDDFSESSLDYVLDFDSVPPARFTPTGNLTADLIRELKGKSVLRQLETEDLRRLQTQKEKVHALRAMKEKVFSEALLRAERKELSAEEEAKNEAELEEGAKRPPFGSSPYTRELLAIAGDFVAMAGGHK